MDDQRFDLGIIGAGAAGLMTAIAAAREAKSLKKSISIVLIDSKPKVGAKILMSGGTRCNVTNERVTPFDFEGGPKHFVKHVLESFTPAATVQFFKSIGVDLVLEPSGKLFPVTNSAQTVLDALLKEASRDVQLIPGVKITEIKKNGWFVLSGAAQKFQAKKVILTTGGLSHPGTGSDGSGFEIAKSLGHHLISTFPALTPLLTEDSTWKSLSGVSLEAELSFYRNGKKQASRGGAFLFTHFGFSGPSALDISRFFAAANPEDKPEIKACFLPKQDETSFQNLWNQKTKGTDKLIKNFLIQEFQLPARFVEVFLGKINLDASSAARACSKEKLRLLTKALFFYPLEVSGVYGYQKAEVTAGGIDLKEVKVQTMESKMCEGFYLAGEILDVDGRIGGFNFQWAWSTGAIAGRSAVRSLAV